MEDGMLLPGQRFCPTEDELLMFYLKPKVNEMEVPGKDAYICEMDLYGDEEEPWKIWQRYEKAKANDLRKKKDLYFFTQKKSERETPTRRTDKSGGTWKALNAVKKIYLLDQDQKPTTTLLGVKKTYIYQNKKNKLSEHHGRWTLYEFELDASQLPHETPQVDKSDQYVIYLLRNQSEHDINKKRNKQKVDMSEGDDEDPEEPTCSVDELLSDLDEYHGEENV